MKLVKLAQLQLSTLQLDVLFGRCGEGGRRQAVLLVAAAVAAAVLALGRGAAATGSTDELAQERDVVFAVGVVQVVLDAAEARRKGPPGTRQQLTNRPCTLDSVCVSCVSCVACVVCGLVCCTGSLVIRSRSRMMAERET